MRQLETRSEYPVAVMCKALEVSRSGYYAWRDRPPSARAREDERLSVAIRATHAASRQTYGARRVQAELRAQGFDAGRDRIGRLRRQMELRCKQKRRSKVTTDSNHALPVADNLLQQRFEADAPDRVWLTDLTLIPSANSDRRWLQPGKARDARLGTGVSIEPAHDTCRVDADGREHLLQRRLG
jgi:putative transposase